MTKTRTARRILPSLLLVVLAAQATRADAAEDAAAGIRVLPKANKNYLVDGKKMSFTELEAQLTSQPPARLVIEQSRQQKGAACMVMLGIKLGIPIWTRSLNGRMQKLKVEVDSAKVDTIDKCR
jgi:predicted RecA/RadA family phage recombinase